MLHRMKITYLYLEKGSILVNEETLKSLKEVVTLIDEKKGVGTKVFDISGLSIITDFFIITEGDNPKQVKAIVDNLLENFTPPPRSYEGLDRKNWVVLDYGNFIVHIFQNEARQFYDLESLWGDEEVDLNGSD